MEANQKGIYVEGVFNGRADFDPNQNFELDSNGSNTNSFILELDSNGGYNWHEILFSNDELLAYEVELDHSGNSIISGIQRDTVYIKALNREDTILPRTSYANNFVANNFILKLDSQGRFLWSKTFETNVISVHQEVVTDQQNNIYIAGRFVDSLDVDPGPARRMIYGQDASYILKLDSMGDFESVKVLPFYLYSLGSYENDIYFYGEFRDTVSIQILSQTKTLSPANGFSDYIYGKLRDSTILWVNTIKSRLIQGLYSGFEELTIDREGAIYFSGQFIDTLRIEGDLNSSFLSIARGTESYIFKTDSIGRIDWTFQFGNQYGNVFERIKVDREKNIYVASIATGLVNLNSDSGNAKVFFPTRDFTSIIKFDSLRRFQWYRSLDQTFPTAMNWTSSNQLTFTGGYQDSLVIKDTLLSSRQAAYVGRIVDCEPILKYDTLSVCSDDSLYFNPNQTIDSGIVYTSIPANIGCDTLLSTFLKIFPSKNDTSLFTICEGDSLVFQNNVYKTAGIFKDLSTNQFGCDSNQTLIIQIDSTTYGSWTVDICEGDTILVGENRYFNPGIYTDTLVNANGCDSILNTVVRVLAKSRSDLNIQLCEGDSVQINNRFYKNQGIYSDTLINANGCDSILSITITKIDTTTTFNRFTICENDSILVGSNFYTESGVYFDTLSNTNGCDSVVITDLSTLPINENIQKFELCKRDSIKVGDSTYQKAGTYTNVFIDRRGCDSIITTIINKIDLDLKILANNVLEVSEQGANYQWIDCDNGMPLLDETSQRLQYSSDGSFRVVVGNENCSDTSDCIRVSFKSEYKLKVFPNPITENFNVVIPTKGNLKLYDSKASLVWENEYYTAGLKKVETKPLQSGMYFLVFHGEQGRLTEKLVFVGNRK